jgi:gliding motility-associated-like protein
MAVSNVSWVCPNGTNGSAVISMTPAAGSPPGSNSFSVYALGQTPAYNASLSPTPLTAYTSTGLAAGSYSVSTFDGSCKYGASFNVQTLIYNYSVSPLTSTLCSGNAVAAGTSFTPGASPGQYTFSWTPATFLAGNTQASTIISPTTAPGTVTNIIYTVVATPTALNCPQTRTISIVVANPATPTLSPIQPLCNNGNPITIVATPGGGTFTALNPNLIGSSSGVLSPSFAANGINTYTYTHSVFMCSATNTANFQVSQFNTAALSAGIPNLCVTNSPVNLMNIVQSSLTGVWSSTAAGVVTNSGGTYNFNPAGLSTNTYVITYNTSSTPNPTTCPHFTTLVVSVTNTVVPYISQKAPFCNNQSAFTMTVSPSGGFWSGNGITSQGVVTPTSLPAGNHVLSYTQTTGPCVNINSTTLSVLQFNSAALTGTVPHLCATNNPFNLLNIMQSTTNASWVGFNVNTATGLLNPAGSPTGTSVFVYTVTTPSSPNSGLCTDTRTIAVSISNPPSPSIVQVGPFCNNAGALQLSVTPNIGSWTQSPYLTNTGLFTPSLSPVGNNLVQYVIGTSTCNSQQTKQIGVEAFVSAAIAQAIPDQCNTSSPVNLTPITSNNLGVWTGQGISGTSFNPALSGAGTFTLTYNTLSSPSGLCPDVASISVNVYSLALPAVTKVGPYCTSTSPKQLQVSPVGGYFGGANTNAVTSQGLFNPGAAIIGDNIVNYSITVGPCVAYAQTTVSVEKFVPADLEHYPGTFCKNNFPVNMDSYMLNPGGNWGSVNSPASISGSMFTPSKANIGENVLTYTTHSMPTATLCPDVSTVTIKVNDIPEIQAISDIQKACVPAEIKFNTPTTNSGSGVWDMGDGSQTEAGLSANHTYTAPGTYSVMFSYADKEKVCFVNKLVEFPINIFETPKAAFSLPDEVLISNPEIQLVNSSSVLGNNTYTWKIGNLYQINEVNPTVLFPKTGKYQITLTAITPNNCKDEITKTIDVKNDFNIYIPSSFSPNFDKLNDEFKPVFSPYGLDSKTYEMEIFDRWGHSLFHTTDVTKGWDGSMQNKGEPLKEEVYVYKIKYKDSEGNVYNKMGHVSLIK